MPGVIVFIIVLFIILGITFSLGKGAFLIAGYNTSSKEKKAEYDEKALCKFMGKSMFVLAFCIFLWGLGTSIDQPIIFDIGVILFFCTVVFMVIYANTKNRFKK